MVVRAVQHGEVRLAAKILRMERAGVECFKQHRLAFENEVRIMAVLQHHNILQYVGYGEHEYEGEPARWLLMEVCPLGSLDIAVKRQAPAGPFEKAWVLKTVKEMCSGVAYLHSQGVVHRDLKAANIFLTDAGAKVGDFDASLKIEERPVTPVGSANYMSPEMFALRPYGFATDVWSLGMLMYEVIYREVAYGEDIHLARLEELVKAGTWPQNGVATSLESGELQEVMESCWTLEENARPSADLLLARLSCV